MNNWRTAVAGILMAAAAGCSKGNEPVKNEPVSNAATEYTNSLKSDTQKAQEAADKANKAIAASQEAAQSAAAAGE